MHQRFIPTKLSRTMMQVQARILLLALICFYITVSTVAAQDGYIREQIIELQPGWNAVYLEIDPLESDPAILFGGTTVDVVASFASSAKGAQYVENPSVSMLNAYGWAVWYAPSRSDSFLTTLYSVLGSKAYLIHARTNELIAVSGTTAPEVFAWTPNAYNFVGFAVEQPGAPTFAQFFGGSPAHDHNKIYHLEEGTWRQVLSPETTPMKAGEAFWIYCDGRSDFSGPLEISTSSRFGVNLDSQGTDEIIFRNRAAFPMAFTVEHLVDPANPIPISTPVMTVDESTGNVRTMSIHFDAAHFEQAFPVLEVDKAIRLPLALRVQDAGPGLRHSLLKVTTDLGTISYIPLSASRDEQ